MFAFHLTALFFTKRNYRFSEPQKFWQRSVVVAGTLVISDLSIMTVVTFTNQSVSLWWKCNLAISCWKIDSLVFCKYVKENPCFLLNYCRILWMTDSDETKKRVILPKFLAVIEFEKICLWLYYSVSWVEQIKKFLLDKCWTRNCNFLIKKRT